MANHHFPTTQFHILKMVTLKKEQSLTNKIGWERKEINKDQYWSLIFDECVFTATPKIHKHLFLITDSSTLFCCPDRHAASFVPVINHDTSYKIQQIFGI